MNTELVKQLMKQAGTDSSGKWMGVEHAEKLVSLIVKECASIADEPTSQPFDSYGKKIKKHFGVTD